MLWGTFWGGSGHDHLFGTVGACIGVSAHSDIFVTGETTSPNLPMQNPGGGAFFKNTNSGASEGFVVKFENDILSPLPIELTDFSCESTLLGINLYWITASEFNNDYFTIEKTTDGNNFEILTTVKGSNNSASSKHYYYQDKTPNRGANYYRLSQTDKNGQLKYFKMITCEQSPEMNEEVTINVYSVTGQLMYTHKTSNYREYLEKSDLARGIYLVEIVGSKSTNSIKYIKSN
jgi:hypothetical protein